MLNKNREIPVYLFLGFLESGKTKFIQETLEDKRFNNGERTLLLVCEEGIEEYDPTLYPKKSRVEMRVLEDKSQLNEEYLNTLIAETKAERVVIEYNGMWQVKELFENAPEDWVIYQTMFFADASTFMSYNANMRSLVVDKLNITELAAFNRFEKDMDMNEFHKIVRGVSRRADICYEHTDGQVIYDDIQDPLPFDVEAAHIVIKDEDYALWYRDIMEEPQKYDGKTITLKAVAAKNKMFPTGSFALGRHVMTCCVDDIQYCWAVAQYDGEFDPGEKRWVMVTADIKVKKHKLYKGEGPVLTVTDIADAAPPEKEVATFY